MEDMLIEIQKLSNQIKELKEKIENYETSKSFEGWISRKKLMEFLDFGETKMCELLKSKHVVVSEIGNKKFIKKESVIKFLESKIKQ